MRPLDAGPHDAPDTLGGPIYLLHVEQSAFRLQPKGWRAFLFERQKMSVDFASIGVGDRVKMPAAKWGGENRQVYEQAAQYARTVEGEIKPQFQVSGTDDGNGYWLEQIR